MQTIASIQPRESSAGAAKGGCVGVLYTGELTQLDRNAIKIAEFLGLQVELMPARSPGDLSSLERTPGLIVAADTLASLAANQSDLAGVRSEVQRLSSQIFIFGFRANGSHDSLLRSLTREAIRAVARVSGRTTVRVCPKPREFCRQFAGLTVSEVNPAYDSCFEGDATNYLPLVEAGDKPFAVRTESREGQLTLVACSDLANLDEPISAEASLLKFFSRLVPLMMFLREAFPGYVWENPEPAACWIIDDPLLTQNYGFLNYRRLLEEMASTPFAMSIAFIPYNFKRSSREAAGLFLRHPTTLSLCVHGCDHTGGEFGGTDPKFLEQQATTAIERMGLHKKRTGVPFDSVMVFPQGIFSSVSIGALQRAGYVAAINTTSFPVDGPSTLPLRELLGVVVDRFANFPVFARRYPATLADTALNLFLGKPALLVEHHGYFRNGFAPLRAAVEAINRMDPGLKWMSPEQVCSRATVSRAHGRGRKTEVRFFCDRLQFQNTSRSAGTFLFRRCNGGPDAAIRFSGDDAPGSTAIADGDLIAECTLLPGQSAEIKISRTVATSPGVESQKLRYRAGVFLRRRFSELRDNYLDKSQSLTRA
ncbi:MAG TPA: hypothetical protein VL793_15995, partial [Patescibacteria group bacterium]|nr:hypothetical protein [Patescibacteria group bacterium]